MISMARAVVVRRLALVVVLATAAVLGEVSAGWADGPLTLKVTLPLGTRANDVIVEGNLAYVATDKGMTIVDITNPLAPFVRGSVVSPRSDYCQGLAKKGSYVYLAAGWGGTLVINVSNPDAPQLIGKAVKAGRIFDVAVHPTANAAYSVSYNGELYVWDITNPATPVLKQTIGVIRWGVGVCNLCITRMTNLITDGQSYLTGVTTAGNVVVTADWGYGGLYAWDSTNPLHLTFRGTHRFKNSISRMEVDLGRDVVYALLTYGGYHSGVLSVPLSLFFQSDPAGAPLVSYSAHSNTPINDKTVCPECDQVDSLGPMDGGGIGFSPNGKYAFYIGGRANGELAILDVVDPTQMSPVVRVPVGPMGLRTGREAGIVAHGDYLIVAAAGVGFRVYEFPGLSATTP
jgi:LVIVD repeat-containing protein